MMTASRSERRLWLASLVSLPFLAAACFYLGGRRNIDDYLHRVELSVQQNEGSAAYANATWKLAQARLIGDGRDTNIKLPDGMRLIVVRLSAHADAEIGQSWMLCNFALVDEKGRRWQHLDFIMSSDLSRDLDPKATPVDGCDAVSRHPPAKGDTAIIEEKFVVPAEAAPSLSARLSFMATRPDALSMPLHLQ